MTPKTYTKTTETVDSIIDCAAWYFRKFGYKKTTVSDIASRAHVSKKTLYSIFASKEELLREVAWRDTIETVRKFSVTVPPTAHPDQLLLSLCRFIFTDRIKRGKQGVFRGINDDDNDIRRLYLDALKRVVKDIYDAGLQRGIFKPVESVFATEIVVNILITALNSFYKTTEPVRMFNDALTIIADSVAFKNRINFDEMG